MYEPGRILFDKYRVDSVIGRGGMGVVLRVTHLHLGEHLAIKILLPEHITSPDVTARFLREAQSVVRLRGEHVARVTDVGVFSDGAPYMLMEYLDGTDLAVELERRRRLPPGEVVDYVLQACEALAEAHTLGIIHRDIKPANLFLARRPDGTPLVKVLDFGISKSTARTTVITRNDSVMGTPGYMSPEQMKATKEVDARSDIWSLGIVLYELLNGRCPFQSESFSAIVLLAATEPPPPMEPNVPRGLQAIVLRCLEKDRERRYPTIAALAGALAPFARDQRAAAVTVDRTSGMSRVVSGAQRAVTAPDRSPSATTLSGSAGFTPAPPRRRGYLIAAAATGSIAVFATVAAIARGPAVEVHSAKLAVAEAPPDAGAEVAIEAPVSSRIVIAVDASVAPPAVVSADAHTVAEVIPLDAGAALTLMKKVVLCKQDVRGYRLVTLYACDSHDEKTAHQYFAKVPQQFQAGLTQSCQQNGIALP